MNINFRYFPLNNLRKVVREELTKPRTALVTTQGFLPLLWPESEEAMKMIKSLCFVHNYHRREEDTSIFQLRTSLLVVSALTETRVHKAGGRSC